MNLDLLLDPLDGAGHTRPPAVRSRLEHKGLAIGPEGHADLAQRSGHALQSPRVVADELQGLFDVPAPPAVVLRRQDVEPRALDFLDELVRVFRKMADVAG